ncbi:MAG: nucleoside-diphosphate sugar epimerase/dehydratase [Bacteroidales bacterium]|jgi:FlaA1/EpsC-like NDP-sugar epimerase|nr:nucleoside-diphosphate sugar epimerase/dehydratase [Bacteroidales bacterium]
MTILPSWVILIFDMCCVVIAIILAIIIRSSFGTNLPQLTGTEIINSFFYILLIRVIIFFLFGTQKMVVRYTNSKNLLSIFFASILATLILYGSNIVVNKIFHLKHFVPMSIIFMELSITLVLLIFYRIQFKTYYLETINPSKFKKNIIIFGAGESGILTKRVFDRDQISKYNVLSFFDEDPNKIGMTLESLKVRPFTQLADYLDKYNISFLIISIQNLPAVKKNEITEIALQHNVKVLVVPPVMKWINGELSFKQIRKIKIEELLEREPIEMDKTLVSKDLTDKTIIITGAAGSIGSEIVRQIMEFDYKKLILIDNAETPSFFLTNQCNARRQMRNIDILLVDITDKVRMEEIMSKYKPDVIYHAAAYKHVPLMEENVNSSIKVNVEGTKNLADLAVKYGTRKFVMVSTDKAVNPTSVMGASKRIAEIYVQSLNFEQEQTKFITTRFGNVLGSNGSVIPVFREQIENGGPITVTHPEITRYFMTISEACQLVITAGAMGKGGEIFIFDMGESVKIYDLALKMIKLSGLTLGKDINIEFSGLRQGEKLYEELLANQENTKQTEHEKIMIADVRRYSYSEVSQKINTLIGLKNNDAFDIVKEMKAIVPEYKSQNSRFDILNR